MGNPELFFFSDQKANKIDIILQKIKNSIFLVKTFMEKHLLISSPLKGVLFTKLLWKLLNLHRLAVWIDWKNVGIILLQKEVREKQFCS